MPRVSVDCSFVIAEIKCGYFTVLYDLRTDAYTSIVLWFRPLAGVVLEVLFVPADVRNVVHATSHARAFAAIYICRTLSYYYYDF